MEGNHEQHDITSSLNKDEPSFLATPRAQGESSILCFFWGQTFILLTGV